MVLEKEGQRRSSSLSEARSNAAVKASKQRDGKKERETSETTTARRRRRRRREEEEDIIIIIIIIIIALLGFPWLPQRETHGRRRIQSARESEIPRGRVERFVRLVQLRERVARTVRRETTYRGVVGFVRDEESTEGIIVVRVFLSSVVGGGHTKQQKHL